MLTSGFQCVEEEIALLTVHDRTADLAGCMISKPVQDAIIRSSDVTPMIEMAYPTRISALST